jgi:hypothetical protein
MMEMQCVVCEVLTACFNFIWTNFIFKGAKIKSISILESCQIFKAFYPKFPVLGNAK